MLSDERGMNSGLAKLTDDSYTLKLFACCPPWSGMTFLLILAYPNPSYIFPAPRIFMQFPLRLILDPYSLDPITYSHMHFSFPKDLFFLNK